MLCIPLGMLIVNLIKTNREKNFMFLQMIEEEIETMTKELSTCPDWDKARFCNELNRFIAMRDKIIASRYIADENNLRKMRENQ